MILIRKVRRIVLRILAACVLVLATLLLALNLTWNFFPKNATETDYSDWMAESIDDARLVIDVAMLGAHDAFSSDIGYFSAVDPLSAASIQTGFTGALIKGFSVKQSKTQVSTASTLLARGIRYFDVRLTFDESSDQWYVTHSYFSRPLSEDLAEIEEFLSAHPGEFVLIDIQHVYGVDYDDAEAFAEIRALFESAGLLDRTVQSDGKELDEVTYGDVTAAGGGVLLFSKFAVEDPCFWDYGMSIRSAWPDTDDAETAYACLTDEAELISSGAALTGNQIAGFVGVDARHGIRIMQGVLTMQLDGAGILEAIGSWSLLAKARRFNADLIEREEFSTWLSAMPVVMVDYADSNYRGFNDAVMAVIIAYDRGLSI
jgi:hypothetical protein